MKHFELKNFFGGAGGKKPKAPPAPKPPYLEPPSLGEYKHITSYSYSEIIDLISDGPIEGLTNKDGYILDANTYLQGVFLNDVPVQINKSSDVGRIDAITSFSAENDFSENSKNLFDNFDTSDYWKLPSAEGSRYYQTVGSRRWRTLGSYICTSSTERQRLSLPYFGGGERNLRYATVNRNINYGKAPEDQFEVDVIWNNGKNRTVNPSWITSESGPNFYLRDFGHANNWECSLVWHKQYTGSLGENSYYIEASFSNWRYEAYVDPRNPATWGPASQQKIPIYYNKDFAGRRDKILNGIERLEGMNASPDVSRYQKQFLAEKLKLLGHQNLENRDANFSYSLNAITVRQLMDKKGITWWNYERNYYSFSYYNGFDNSIGRYWHMHYPYVFTSVDENYEIDGYVKEDHEDVFINPKYANITLYDDQKTDAYNQGDVFAYEGLYYTVLIPWNPSNETSTPPEEIKRIEDPITNLETNPAKLQPFILDEPEVLIDKVFNFTSKSKKIYDGQFFDLMIPQLDQDGKWNGKVDGFNMDYLHPVMAGGQGFNPNCDWLDDANCGSYSDGATFIKLSELDFYTDVDGFGLSRKDQVVVDKFNYSNVLLEFRKGEEIQDPLGFFKNIYIDNFYNDKLLGPFSTQYTAVQTLAYDRALTKSDGNPVLNFDNNTVPKMDEKWLFAKEESSTDVRNSGGTNRDFSNWDNARNFDEVAQPVTHIIQNPNVSSCFITLWVKQLSDMFEDQVGGIQAGQKKPTVLNIKVTTGLVEPDGNQVEYSSRFIQIVSLVESPITLELGSEDNLESTETYTDIREVNPYSENDTSVENVHKPFVLPEIRTSIDDSINKESQDIKRYIEITKLSTETESSLIKKDVELLKVTEIIEQTCSYPLSAIAGIKTDSRVFNEIPKRSYRCKLKRVKIPSNYEPLNPEKFYKDKRIYKKLDDYKSTPKNERRLYLGDWDGSFKEGWTDNPAWILYDILLSKRYGLGDFIKPSEVNKWDLYKIARFCDAVDDEGYFIGVSNGIGGLEPRFNCNILFSKTINIFDAINSISAIFRGVTYYQDSYISFNDDRIKEPIAIFNNSNVKDGFFAYSSSRRDEKFNAIEVSFKDKNDDYKTKIEYIEDEQDILERGLFKKEIVAVGITSKAMAIRAAKHVLYQNKQEDETIVFTAGTESLLCKPGDLIIVDDELKTLNTNFGRVLNVDYINGAIRTSEIFNVKDYDSKVTLYIPSGNKTLNELQSLAGLNRNRLSEFYISGNTSYNDFYDNFSGLYKFSEYTKGYEIDENGNFDSSIPASLAFEEYALYTGENSSKPIMWFDTNSTGWVFSTGKSLTSDNNYNKFITSGNSFNFERFSKPISEEDISSSSGWLYDSAQSNNRSTPEFSFSGLLSPVEGSNFDYFQGILNEEIDLSSSLQTRSFNITGWGGLNEIQAKEYGDILYIDKNDINYNLLKFVPEGTVYRFQSKEYSDQIYKIQTIKEQESNSYDIIASKYSSGKYFEIENEINLEGEEDILGYDQLEYKIKNTNYITLSPPEFTDVTTGFNNIDNVYSMSISWEDIEDADSHNLFINGQKQNFDGNNYTKIDNLNIYTLNVDRYDYYDIGLQSVAETFSNKEFDTVYYNSVVNKLQQLAGDPNQLDDDGLGEEVFEFEFVGIEE